MDAEDWCREEESANPKEGALNFRVRGRPKSGRTLERREAYERMNPDRASGPRDGSRDEDRVSVRNGEEARVRGTNRPAARLQIRL